MQDTSCGGMAATPKPGTICEGNLLLSKLGPGCRQWNSRSGEQFPMSTETRGGLAGRSIEPNDLRGRMWKEGLILNIVVDPATGLALK